MLTTRANDTARGLLEQLVFRRPPVIRDSQDLPSAVDEQIVGARGDFIMRRKERGNL